MEEHHILEKITPTTEAFNEFLRKVYEVMNTTDLLESTEARSLLHAFSFINGLVYQINGNYFDMVNALLEDDKTSFVESLLEYRDSLNALETCYVGTDKHNACVENLLSRLCQQYDYTFEKREHIWYVTPSKKVDV